MRPFLVVLAAMAISCGSDVPTASGTCRRYPSALLRPSGRHFPCTLSGGTLLECRDGFDYWKWSYPSAVAFVEEAAHVGRFRMSSVERYVYGFWSGGWESWEWTYDSSGRAIRRIERVGPNNVTVRPFVSSAAEFTAWDSRGRPTQGTVNAAPLTIEYDEDARTTTWSTGEATVQDRDGNFLSWGGYELTVAGTREFCL